MGSHQAKGRIHNTRERQKQSPWEVFVTLFIYWGGRETVEESPISAAEGEVFGWREAVCWG